jgi:hypothetical protein
MQKISHSNKKSIQSINFIPSQSINVPQKSSTDVNVSSIDVEKGHPLMSVVVLVLSRRQDRSVGFGPLVWIAEDS